MRTNYTGGADVLGPAGAVETRGVDGAARAGSICKRVGVAANGIGL